MDVLDALEAVEAIRKTVPRAELAEFDAGLAQQFNLTAEVVGSLAVDATNETTHSPEATPLTPESLMASFDIAYLGYSTQVETVNAARAEVKGRKKPAQLEVVSEDTIRADVEAILADETFMAELQADVDHFTKNPEVDSPVAGFDIRVIPEGLNAADEKVLAKDQQLRIKAALGINYNKPYIRPEAYNDKRTPETTGKGYRIVFAPRHYNVPKGTTTEQTAWMKTQNQRTTATELQTATDTEALSHIDRLLADNTSPKGAGYDVDRYRQSYFRRFDQAPHDDSVSGVYVFGNGLLFLGRSFVHDDRSTRALVVPKA